MRHVADVFPRHLSCCRERLSADAARVAGDERVRTALSRRVMRLIGVERCLPDDTAAAAAAAVLRRLLMMRQC